MKLSFQILALILLSSTAFLVNNHVFDATLMEARNFVAAREVLDSNNWLLPTMNGELRLAKPPMPTWFSALAGKFAGSTDNLTAMRFPAGFIALSMVLFLFGFVKTITKDKYLPFISAAVLATSGLAIQMGRVGSWDIFCHSFMVGAIWCLSIGWNRDKNAFGPFVMAGIFLGLSAMSKGPVAFYAMLIPFLIAYITAFGWKKVKSKWKESLVAILISIALGSWWILYIYIQHPEAAEITAQAETTAWINRHIKPFWYYLSFPVFIGFWSLFLVGTFVWPYAKGRIDKYGQKNYLFLIVWMLATLILLSVIPEKKQRYLFPILIPMAILAGSLIRSIMQNLMENKDQLFDRLLLYIHGSISTLMCLLIPVAYLFYKDKIGDISSTALILTFLVFIGIGLTTLFFMIKKRLKNVFLLNLIMIGLGLIVILPITPKISYKNDEFRNINETRNISAIEKMDWYSVGTFNLQRVYAVGKSVKPWDYTKDKNLLKKLPIAVFTDKHPSAYFKGELLNNIEVELLESFLYHRKRKNRERFLSIIRLKNPDK